MKSFRKPPSRGRRPVKRRTRDRFGTRALLVPPHPTVFRPARRVHQPQRANSSLSFEGESALRRLGFS